MPEQAVLVNDDFSSFQIEDWGLTSYQIAMDRQLDLVEKVKAGDMKDTLIFCTHPPVVTLGRSSRPEDLDGWTGEVYEVSRGGRATYHGPSQLIIYPILSLESEARTILHRKDIHAYLRCLELSLIRTLQTYGLDPEIKPTSDFKSELLNMTGVWVGGRKVVSIGVAVRSWVTYHGIALNVDRDPEAFKGLKPCGFSQSTMVSMEELLHHSINREELKIRLIEAFNHYLC